MNLPWNKIGGFSTPDLVLTFFKYRILERAKQYLPLLLFDHINK